MIPIQCIFGIRKKKNGQKINDIPKYELFKYICEFKNTDITKLNYNDLTCMYNESIGFNSKDIYIII